LFSDEEEGIALTRAENLQIDKEIMEEEEEYDEDEDEYSHVDEVLKQPSLTNEVTDYNSANSQKLSRNNHHTGKSQHFSNQSASHQLNTNHSD